MGIRNLVDRVQGDGRQGFITPHGDQEHRADAGLVPGLQLITPHGDQEQEELDRLLELDRFSLPLMGIRNF